MSDFKISSIERSRSIIKDALGRKMDRNSISPFFETKLDIQRVAPKMDFEEPLGNFRCRLGETAILNCSLSSHAAPSITWLKNSFPLGIDERISKSFDGKRIRLTITRVQPSDFGCYECVAMTTDAKCFTTGTLLMENSLADSSKDLEQKVETRQQNYKDILRKAATSENKEDIKRSVMQRLEAAKNRFSYQPPQSDLSRKKSLYETSHYQSTYKIEPNLQRSATTVRQKLLEWCKIQLRGYKDVNITNFSTSWNDGLAFCALIHRFCPDAFDFDKLDRNDVRHNFQLAFDIATKHGVTPLLDVDDMVRMKNPDWKCIFMYVESIYRAFAVNKNPIKNE